MKSTLRIKVQAAEPDTASILLSPLINTLKDRQDTDTQNDGCNDLQQYSATKRNDHLRESQLLSAKAAYSCSNLRLLRPLIRCISSLAGTWGGTDTSR